MTQIERPRAPHIQIYRWTLTMALSILHRASGIALYGGTLLFVWWLIAIASGEGAYHYVARASDTWVGQFVLFGYTWALMHHMCGGIRHFVWDIGKGFELRHVEYIARISAIVPLVLTAAIWMAVAYVTGSL